jgi:uracil-DNA glycosylase family 4
MFVAEKSDTVSCALGDSFSDVCGDFLFKILSQAGINSDECYFTYLVKCNDFDTKSAAVCSKWLEAEIKAIQPNYVVSLGVKTANSFLPKNQKFKDCLYQIYNNVLIAPSLHTILNGSTKDVNTFSKKIKELYDIL